MVRNRVKRRLRAILATRLDALPEGASVVVRALPDSATASFSELEADVSGALGTALSKAAR